MSSGKMVYKRSFSNSGGNPCSIKSERCKSTQLLDPAFSMSVAVPFLDVLLDLRVSFLGLDFLRISDNLRSGLAFAGTASLIVVVSIVLSSLFSRDLNALQIPPSILIIVEASMFLSRTFAIPLISSNITVTADIISGEGEPRLDVTLAISRYAAIAFIRLSLTASESRVNISYFCRIDILALTHCAMSVPDIPETLPIALLSLFVMLSVVVVLM